MAWNTVELLKRNKYKDTNIKTKKHRLIDTCILQF